MNKIKTSTPKISLINNIGTPPNSPRKYTLEIADSSANIHIFNESTPIISSVIMSNDMSERPQNGSRMDSSHVKTLQIRVIT